MTTVSVILPLYTCADSVDTCFAALDAMDLREHEVLVVDDGSTDGTLDLARAWAARRDGVTVLAQPVNAGVAAARNLALTHATGRYVWFVDHDDTWSEDLLDVLVAEAERTAADVVVCRAVRTTAGGRVRELLDGTAQAQVLDAEQTVAAVLRGQVRGYLWNKLFRRDRLPVPMFPPMRSQSDLVGLMPVVARSRRTAFVPDVLYRHVAREGSITNTRDPDLGNLHLCREAVREAVRTVGDPPGLLAAHRRWEAAFFSLDLANTALRLGSGRAGRSRPVSEAQQMIPWTSLPRLVVTGGTRGVRAALLKAGGPAYPLVYRSFVGARGAVERVTDRLGRAPRPEEEPDEVHVYARCTAQDDNLGDVVLRRRLLRTLRAAGTLHVFVGPASDGLLEALSLHPEDRLYRDEAAWRRDCLRRRRGTVSLADQPGEFQMRPFYVWQQLSLLPLAWHARRSGGAVVRVGLGARSHHGVMARVLAVVMGRADVLAWRDPHTRSSLRCGATMPDWAFDDDGPDARTDDDGGHGGAPVDPAPGAPRRAAGQPEARDLLAVSLRGDRDAPRPEWVAAVRAFCADRSLHPVVVTQVHRDGERGRELARLLDADLLPWQASTHREQELRLREVYRRSEMVLSDRLHVLVVALTEGATPVCLTANPETKVGRHFDEIRLRDVSVSSEALGTPEILAELSTAEGRRQEAMQRLDEARHRVRDVDERVLAAIGGTR